MIVFSYKSYSKVLLGVQLKKNIRYNESEFILYNELELADHTSKRYSKNVHFEKI